MLACRAPDARAERAACQSCGANNAVLLGGASTLSAMLLRRAAAAAAAAVAESHVEAQQPHLPQTLPLSAAESAVLSCIAWTRHPISLPTDVTCRWGRAFMRSQSSAQRMSCCVRAWQLRAVP